VNDGPPAVGRDAITEVARSFMTTFPDLQVFMDGVEQRDGGAIYRWTLTGGPVRISGYEEWTLGPDGLILKSLGHFDAAEYQRQLAQSAVQAPSPKRD